MTLALYASRNGITSVDYMRVDVEGRECTVFAGSREILASSPNLVIMFESVPKWCKRACQRQEDTFELLRNLGSGLFVWDNRTRKWAGDETSLLIVTTVWASRDVRALPVP
jgi:hypothetical protein